MTQCSSKLPENCPISIQHFLKTKYNDNKDISLVPPIQEVKTLTENNVNTLGRSQPLRAGGLQHGRTQPQRMRAASRVDVERGEAAPPRSGPFHMLLLLSTQMRSGVC